MATYVIGDIQGCFDEFLLLLEKVKFKPYRDRLWLAGDLVSRGPKSLQVVQFAYQNRDWIDIVLGNHDLHLLASYYLNKKTNPKDKLSNLLKHPQVKTLLKWLRQQPVAIYDKDLNVLMTHAGVPPAWDLEQTLACAYELEQVLAKKKSALDFFNQMYGNQPANWQPGMKKYQRLRFTTNALTRMRFCHLDQSLNFSNKGSPSSRNQTIRPWFELNPTIFKQTQLVFGHWAALNGRSKIANLYPLDTGCVWGNKLTALRLEDKKRFSIKALQKWA